MDEISHKGRVTNITPDFTTVEIISKSACSSCHASGLCGLGEYKKKEICVKTSVFDDYKIGQEVNVVLERSMGMKAVWISYAIPLVILVVLIIALTMFGLNELQVGLFSLLGTGFYYLSIFFFRDRLAKEYVFTLRKIN